MKPILAILTFLSFHLVVHAQDFSLYEKKAQDSMKRKERVLNVYANRKYNFTVSESFYGRFPKYQPFGRFDISFEDRLSILDKILNPARYQVLIGIGFEPYQGTKLHVGAEYELLPTRYKTTVYVGGQYLIGLAQSTVMDNNISTIDVGFHNYMMPFMGIQYWPGKVNDERSALYQDPGFLQLFFFKLQVGYSFLISNMQVSTKGPFDNNLLEQIKRNTASTVVFKIGLGINIPSRGKDNNKYEQMRSTLKQMKYY